VVRLALDANLPFSDCVDAVEYDRPEATLLPDVRPLGGGDVWPPGRDFGVDAAEAEGRGDVDCCEVVEVVAARGLEVSPCITSGPSPRVPGIDALEGVRATLAWLVEVRAVAAAPLSGVFGGGSSAARAGVGSVSSSGSAGRSG
jgi:hypothetical protein